MDHMTDIHGPLTQDAPVTDRIDISPTAMGILNNRICSKVGDGRSLSESDIGDMLDAIRALSARVATLNARALEQTTAIIKGATVTHDAETVEDAVYHAIWDHLGDGDNGLEVANAVSAVISALPPQQVSVADAARGFSPCVTMLDGDTEVVLSDEFTVWRRWDEKTEIGTTAAGLVIAVRLNGYALRGEAP